MKEDPRLLPVVHGVVLDGQAVAFHRRNDPYKKKTGKKNRKERREERQNTRSRRAAATGHAS